MPKTAFQLLILAAIVTGRGLGAGAGNAELYGGGDLVEGLLRPARVRLSRSLTLLRAGFHAARVCEPADCPAELPACRAMVALSPEQRTACRGWIQDNLAELISWNTDVRSPIRVTRELAPVPSAEGGRAIAAVTRLGAEGPIVFREPSLTGVDETGILALLVHELSHKVSASTGRPISDEESSPPFRRGRDRLDAVGAALALYATRHSVPAQAPGPIPYGIDREKACASARDFRGRYLTGLFIDATGRLPTEDAIRSAPVDGSALDSLASSTAPRTFIRAVAGSPDVRAETVRRVFQRYLMRGPTDEELKLMVSRIGGGVPYEVLVASILGDQEYASMRGADAPAAWLGAVYADLLGRAPDASERKSYLAELPRRDRASLVISILKGNPQSWGRWVRDWYALWLNREPRPDELERAAVTLRSGAGWETVMAGVFASDEYAALQALRWEHCASNAVLATPTRAGVLR